MTIESSHGKPRPTLPRSSDLQPVTVVDADRERCGKRDAHGRFSSGNVVGRGRGWKLAIARVLGRQVDDPIAQQVADDAWRTYCAALRELPSDGAIVRGLAALMSRHEALAAFWHAHAAIVGLTTEDGIAGQDQATKHGQRAERLTVTMLDVARALAKKPDDYIDVEAVNKQADAETEQRREAERRARAHAEDVEPEPPSEVVQP